MTGDGMTVPRANVSTIPPGVSFVDALARGLLARAGGDPLNLARGTVLLPTRRACRAVQEAFLRAAQGRALLLPRLLPLGDLDAEELILAGDEADTGFSAADLPPAMPALRRQLLLGRLIQQWGRVRGQPPSEDQAVRLAGELARLLDQVETEGLDLDRLEDLVPADYAEHWQVTLRFLSILTEHWPDVQASEGCIGPAERRRRLMEAQAEAWQRHPPSDPVIAAGSTGSIPATAALLDVIARLPAGEVVLPGLDRDTDAAIWKAITADPIHPQHTMAHLLARLEVSPVDVAVWPCDGVPKTPLARTRLITIAMHPAAVTGNWRRHADGQDNAAIAEALTGVQRIDCPGPGEEAAVIALVLRQALETPGQRAALVTPDRGLARRVAAGLRRWGLEVDDSAGVPLGDTPPGTFLRATAEAIAGGLTPLALLAALKHPLAAGGTNTGAFRAQVRALETAALRGPRPGPGFAGLRQALGTKARRSPLAAWVRTLEASAAPFAQALRRGKTLDAIVDAHIAFAESLAATDEETGPDRLWAGEAGAAAADFIGELHAAAAGAPPLRGETYPALLATLLAGQAVRPRYGSHPRLSIWGPLEARLQHVDVLVLGGLNEGTWPPEVEPGPWLSRPMRAAFGLPAPERRIGLAAHDFAQAFCAPCVYLTRATRVEGTPTVPSRWLLRLETLLQAFEVNQDLSTEAPRWLAWAEALDRPAQQIFTGPPAPTPPVAARPRKLSVTKVETWMRDPYALYAREVLDLRVLDPLDADPGAADLGTLVHAALEAFLKDHPIHLPTDAEAALLAAGERVFAEHGARPGVRAFWWPRFCRIARWFAAAEAETRPGLARAVAEAHGSLILPAPGGAFELTAKADRIDVRSDGTVGVIDYKTGTVPTNMAINSGIAPQLPLEAAIVLAGGFPGIPPGPLAGLAYWRLTGRDPAGQIKPVPGNAEDRAAEARDGLARLVAAFDKPDTPYHAVPRPQWAARFNDYAHLARIKEWGAGGGAAEGDG